MRPTSQHLSMNRQDDLLQRLKSYVGQIQTKPYDSLHQARKPSQRLNSKINYQENFDSSMRSSTKKYELNLNDYKQSYNSQDFVRQEKVLTNRGSEGQNYLQRNKKSFEVQQNDSKQYWTDRKKSLPLTQVTNVLSLKKNNLQNQLQEPITVLGSKNVTQSTKKRIQERASLIQQDLHEITPRKSFSKQTVKDSRSKSTFDTQIQTKTQQRFQKEEKLNEIRKTLGKSAFKNDVGIQDLLERQKTKTKDLIVDNQVLIPSKNYETLKKMKSQKIENYTKFSMENLVKENDFRKAQKLEKLKKITEINEGINNRIRKLVDNFQNYLTHRVVS